MADGEVSTADDADELTDLDEDDASQTNDDEDEA